MPFDSAANHVVVDCWHQRWLQVVCNLYLRWRCNINSWLLASVAIASSLPAPSFHSLAMLSRQRQSSCCTCCPPPWVWQSSSVVSTSMIQPRCHRRAANCCGTVEAASCFSRQSRDPLDVEARSTLNKVANWQMWLLQLVEATSEGWSTGKQYIFCLFICRQCTSNTQRYKSTSKLWRAAEAFMFIFTSETRKLRKYPTGCNKWWAIWWTVEVIK